jgi:hypothetical protein
MVKAYPVDKFPKKVLRPDIVANHDNHLKLLSDDIEHYGEVCGYRDQVLFDWLLRIFENLGISTVDLRYLDSLAVTKTKVAMFVILVDDTVDNINKRDLDLCEELLKIPFGEVSNKRYVSEGRHSDYLKFARNLWLEITDEIKSYPNYAKYLDSFEFDVRQFLNSIRYSEFVNKHNNAANLAENDAYVHHGMMVMIQLDMDLMCSEKFNDKEFGTLRELAYLSQKLARIGNLISTYPREIIESDMSSEALIKFRKEYGENFKFKLNKLFNREKRYPEFEEKMIREWENEYNVIKELAVEIKSIDGGKFVQSLEFFQEAYRTKINDW